MCVQPAGRDRFRDATSYVSWDHHRLSALLARATLAVDAGDFDQALTSFSDFDDGLARHMRLEEDVVFPLFEARTGLDGPTAALREEHREIAKAATLMRSGVARRDAAAFHEGLRFLRETLPGHNSKEEHILCPTMDVVLSKHERRALAEHLRAR